MLTWKPADGVLSGGRGGRLATVEMPGLGSNWAGDWGSVSFGGEATIQSTSSVWENAARVGFAVLSKGGTCACFRGLHPEWVPETTPPDNSRSISKVNNDDASVVLTFLSVMRRWAPVPWLEEGTFPQTPRRMVQHMDASSPKQRADTRANTDLANSTSPAERDQRAWT